MNDIIRALRRERRKSDRKSKWDKLQVPFEILKNYLVKYQESLNAAKKKCFPPITASTVFSASFYTVQNTSAVRCEEFLQFFTSKVRILGAAFPLCDSDSFACLSHLTCLVKMISSMKTTTWALDTVPPHF